MVKAVTGVIVLIVVAAAWLMPATALACPLPGAIGVEPETMQPMDEANIVPPEGNEAYWYAIEVRLDRDTNAPHDSFFNLSPDERMDASFALAVLAPIIFALLTIGAYAASRRRS